MRDFSRSRAFAGALAACCLQVRRIQSSESGTRIHLSPTSLNLDSWILETDTSLLILADKRLRRGVPSHFYFSSGLLGRHCFGCTLLLPFISTRHLVACSKPETNIDVIRSGTDQSAPDGRIYHRVHLRELFKASR